MTKILTLSNRKNRLFAFEADTLSQQPDGDMHLIEGQGRITFQEGGAVEEMVAGDYPCLLTVTEGDAEQLHLPCRLTFVLLEPDRFAARVTLD